MAKLYKDPSIGNNVNIVVSKLIVLTEDLVRICQYIVPSKLIVLIVDLVRICQYSCVEADRADSFNRGFST